MARLAGRSIVVTGAGSGIGRATARALAAEGARLMLADRDEKGLAESAGLVGAAGGAVATCRADCGVDADVAEVMRMAAERYGGLDGVFANAGILGRPVPFLDLSAEDWSEVLRINLIGPFLAIKHAVPHLKVRGKGAIVCTASVAGTRAGAGPTPYSASKAGVISLVQTAASQLTGTGIRVNAVCPGLIETGMTADVYAAARARGSERKIGQLNPLRRGGEPDEIARLALFLLSDEASYVNGQAIIADGGLSSSLPFVPGKIM